MDKILPLPKPKSSNDKLATILSYAVIFNGLFFIFLNLGSEISIHGHELIPVIKSGPSMLSGLTLLYMGVLLRRRKRTAWFVSLIIYALWLVVYIIAAVMFARHHPHHRIDATYVMALNLFVPTVVVIGLLIYRKAFTVRSDIRSFTIALRFSISVLLVAFVYGVTGFLLMDDMRNFHQTIGLTEAAHRTIDQFGFTTAHDLVAYTRRAWLFERSLSIISIGALVYAFVSLFQPLRARLGDQSSNRKHAETLLKKYPASSEDFFKLWPHDKLYFFDHTLQAGVAYAVHRGVALVVGDPFGNPEKFDSLLDSFEELCRTNDWQIAFAHTEPQHNDWYKKHGFSLQKIGEEAVIDLAHFRGQVQDSKYFRHIRNKFEKQGYTAELLKPPLDAVTVARLRHISRNWLGLPGREERRFMMGYFTSGYLQTSAAIMVLRDKDGSIQAFINQIPSYDSQEINYDLLRHTQSSPGNSNDFLLLNFIDYAAEQGFTRANLGLCPLSGLGSHEEAHALIDNALGFVYNKGDRFYSFTGLRRFKAKYEPAWSPRYIAYREGVPGFTRVVTALARAMKV
ncbi:MAG TPA: phosphatidylglycerol lysyltransferase domain-containing protein [Candidatus Saccharimonadales bacterium]|nr:phosphatidylglycerol lysyltransferase domain-containing protein [Candidatus Saccharimonadales bacterium]